MEEIVRFLEENTEAEIVDVEREIRWKTTDIGGTYDSVLQWQHI